ncbi:MAG: GNAT family N-acetyltransferase [Desulfuromonadales bacterium]|nr:GNAT family N-acetyltransferase [Desulfuromonadales bacterium]
MPFPDGLVPTPWDQKIFGFPTWEVVNPDEEIFAEVGAHPGHYTVKIDPLACKEQLHRHGFYYCDTLLEPFADQRRFVAMHNEQVGIDLAPNKDDILKICHGAFSHGRFHRDFYLDRDLADRRYDQWTAQLCDERNVFGLTFAGALAAFFGFRENKIVLHAVGEDFQGKGLAKYLWSRACCELFSRQHEELLSSVSASNLAIVNLYASLGFRFRKPIDIYHRMVKPS